MQIPLPIKDPRYKSPTMTVGTARGILDCGEDEIIERLELGLLTGWDIGTAQIRRREIRILTATVAANLAEPTRTVEMLPEEAIRLVLPANGKPWISGLELQRVLACSSTLVIDLVSAGLLRTLARTSWRRGPGGSPVVSRESVVEFLELRFV